MGRVLALASVLLALGACSSSTPSRESVDKAAAEATRRCNAYQKAHYPHDGVHVGVMSPIVLCIIEIGPIQLCADKELGAVGSTKQMYIQVAKDGTGRIDHTVSPPSCDTPLTIPPPN